MNTINFLLFISISLLLVSCQEDDIVPAQVLPACTVDAGDLVQNNDTTIEHTCVISINYEPLNRYDYDHPVFNPLNEDEIAFITTDHTANSVISGQEMKRYDFCSNVVTLITDDVPLHVDWSTKDRIIFKGSTTPFSTIKPNGDSLHYIGIEPAITFRPTWNDAGTAFMYGNNDDNLLLVADVDANILDTIGPMFASESHLRAWTWDDDRIFLAYSSLGGSPFTTWYGEYIRATGEFELIHTIPNPNGNSLEQIVEIDYSPSDNRLYWRTDYLIAYHDLTTDEVVHVVEGADNRRFRHFDIVEGGNSIVFSRRNLTKIGDCRIEYDQLLYLVDKDGTNERVLTIPE